jgi:hypothetical protein
MTNETPTEAPKINYDFGAVAARLGQSEEGAKYVTGALDVLADKGLHLGKEARGFIEAAYASKEGIQKASTVYGQKFEEEKENLTPSQILAQYTGVLKGLEKAEKDKFEAIFADEETPLSKITKEYQHAAEVLQIEKANPNSKLINGDMVTRAKEIVEKYNPLLLTINSFEEFGLHEKHRGAAVEATRKRSMSGLAKRLTE